MSDQKRKEVVKDKDTDERVISVIETG